ncbi:hypothetical protein [Halobacterium noricense]|uniref:hypothetical protein n=1 Tax=Halobacterium noricense TaxID=223182 RepID=UPI001E5D191E|nr:hypothetical protein [Halobacterium noricense]UHH25589.1 hypothetical protein LT974_01280 [Halobacterium noricense]
MSFGNNPEREASKPDVKYHEFRKTVQERNEPKHEWVENGIMSVSEFNRLKEADEQAEYREIWESVEQDRREEMMRGRDRHGREAERRERR